MDNARYNKALAFLFGRQHFGVKLGLENMRRLSQKLGDPHTAYPTIHIAGTNGKGSTSSFIATILQAAGYKVGLLTSPHLADFRERIRVDGRKITKSAVTEFIETGKPQIIRNHATYFEVTTALAFWYFKQKKVDWGVIETGLGGRLDATNIITPALSVITNISLEHTDILGKSVYQIAGEKAGIIKPEVPALIGIGPRGDAGRRFREISFERKAPIYFFNSRHFTSRQVQGREEIRLVSGKYAGLRAVLSLPGVHQLHNADLAIRTAEILAANGAAIGKPAIKYGLEHNDWPARFMTVRTNPTIILDAAHNPAGFAVLAGTLRRYFPGRKFHFLVSLVAKKQGDRCLELIAPLAETISTARISSDRADDPFELISRLDSARTSIRVYSGALAACSDLLEILKPSDILIIAGSHFLIGELTPLIKRDGF